MEIFIDVLMHVQHLLSREINMYGFRLSLWDIIAFSVVAGVVMAIIVRVMEINE